jgi:hypothetical protein
MCRKFTSACVSVDTVSSGQSVGYASRVFPQNWNQAYARHCRDADMQYQLLKLSEHTASNEEVVLGSVCKEADQSGLTFKKRTDLTGRTTLRARYGLSPTQIHICPLEVTDVTTPPCR